MARTLTTALVLLWTVSASTAFSQEDSDDEPLRPGLRVEYVGDGALHPVVDEQVAAVWRASANGEAAETVSAQWRGQLFVQVAGQYQLHLYLRGEAKLRLDGKLLISSNAANLPQPAWQDSAVVQLEYGYHSLEIDFAGPGEGGRIGLYWNGPGFQLEPVSVRNLAHAAEQATSDPRETDALLRRLRCAACHDLGQPSAPGPALDKLAGNVSASWLLEFLTKHDAPAPAVDQSPAALTPHFAISPSEALQLAAFLASDAEINAMPPGAAAQGDAAVGRKLFYSVGCLACHASQSAGDRDPDEALIDLRRIGDKRPAAFFSTWLKSPADANSAHTMPVFALTDKEIADLTAQLATLRSDERPLRLLDPKSYTDADRAAGRKLAVKFRCQACHKLPETLPEIAKTPLPVRPDDELYACSRAAGDRGDLPRYDAIVLRRVSRSALQNARLRRDPSQILAERRCLSCHARGGSAGLRPIVEREADADTTLAQLVHALVPPALHGIGDKLPDETLRAAITRRRPARRPWLHVRMPQFHLPDAELDELVRHLIDIDRIPDGARPKSIEYDKPPADADKLVIAEGFGCTSCHGVGKFEPEQIALNARGPNLANLSEHVRREWFDRWVRNPARIVPKMEMPAVQQPVRGALGNDLNQQLAAVWRILSQPGFVPPKAGALRVVRALLPAKDSPTLTGGSRANVLTDSIEIDGRPLVKPLIVGLPNRHNVLFDLAENELAAWWVGDTARQYTRSKSWYWQAAGRQLIEAGPVKPARGWGEFSLKFGEKTLEPTSTGIYRTEFDRIEHVREGVRFTQRVRFKVGETEPVVRIAQTIQTLDAQIPTSTTNPAPRGFVRRISFAGVPAGAAVQLAVMPRTVRGEVDASGTFRLPIQDGSLAVQLRRPSEAKLVMQLQAPVLELRADASGAASCELIYSTDAADEPPRAVVDRSYVCEQKALDVIPGWRATQLALPTEIMPTGLAWWQRSSKTVSGKPLLVLTSLEGRVWLAEDRDGDGLEDRAWPFSDELAAPWGVAAAHGALDVINKYALVRLTDGDGDGRADQMETLASGWPHTLDYHDWAVGLPRDEHGAYFISLPCEQDQRAQQAARWRGHVLRLNPRRPSDDDPREFAVESLAAGFRFPMGIARGARGDLFVTDNQGNYTTFNELNHVVRGARYGFINSTEVKAGFNSPVQPAAVEIPHPWTRSVNGICFLQTPSAVREKLGRDLFGPFEGQLVGCEYDSRRLVRMSLEQVAGQWQGAVYPLSVEPADDALATFEGPLCCQVAPSGTLYVGSIRDSGWGAGNNTGSIVRMEWLGSLPCGIAEVRASSDGFLLRFTQPVDAALASSIDNYAVASYRRIATPDYGGADRDRRREKLASISVSDDRREARLKLAELRVGFVYEIRLKPLVAAGRFFPAEAYYTLRNRP